MILSEPIYRVGSTIVGGPFNGYTLTQSRNGQSAWIVGAEATWQQHLTFLPWGLNGLGVLANYTYTHSLTYTYDCYTQSPIPSRR